MKKIVFFLVQLVYLLCHMRNTVDVCNGCRISFWHETLPASQHINEWNTQQQKKKINGIQKRIFFYRHSRRRHHHSFRTKMMIFFIWIRNSCFYTYIQKRINFTDKKIHPIIRTHIASDQITNYKTKGSLVHTFTYDTTQSKYV